MGGGIARTFAQVRGGSSRAGCWLRAPEVNVLSCNPSVIPLVRRDTLFTLRHGFPRRPARHVAQAARERKSDRERETERDREKCGGGLKESEKDP